MSTIGTITQIQGRGSLGSSGGVTVKMDDGKFQYHPFSRMKPGLAAAVGSSVQVLDRGQSWQVIPGPDDLHPDSHPEPLPIPRVPRPMRPAAPVVAPLAEPNVFELLLAEQKKTNELLAELLRLQLKATST